MKKDASPTQSIPSSPPRPTSASPASFHTAPRSPCSSSQADIPSYQAEFQNRRYRKGVPISAEIRNHCHIFFDEQLYSNALTLLSDLVTSGTSHPDGLERPAYTPIPFHIELVSALLIHPRYTTQALQTESRELPSRAISLLRNILYILGPINANLAEAFSFLPLQTRRIANRRNYDSSSSGSDIEDNFDTTKGIIAQQGRIRRCARDFWHMVGWAFNCSVKYPKRWKYWKVWLGYMLDVLDADWYERERQDINSELEDPDYQTFALRSKWLLISYLAETINSSGPLKRVVRSAFANGSPESLREFPEVFSNETKEVKLQNGQKRKRDFSKIDPLDLNGSDSIFDSDLTDQTPTNSMDNESDDHKQEDDETFTIDPLLGGTESVALRQKVLVLLSRAAAYLPNHFVDTRGLYDLMYFCAKPLPVPAFSLLASHSAAVPGCVPEELTVSWSQLMLLRLLPGSAPRPHSVYPRETDTINSLILEKCFLPFPASTSSANDNAKVSILVESMLRLWLPAVDCMYTPELEAAVEEGIKARLRKVQNAQRKRGTKSTKGEEENDLVWLNSSGERMRTMVAWLKEIKQV